MFKRIDHVALHVGDLDRSVSFYEHHFGFKNYFQHVVPGGPRIAYLKLRDIVLELTPTRRGSHGRVSLLLGKIVTSDGIGATRKAGAPDPSASCQSGSPRKGGHHVRGRALTKEDGTRHGGMFVLRANSFEEREQLQTPIRFTRPGLRTYTLMRWTVNEGSYGVRINYSDQTVTI
jgi:catechol 2,3-dioxygenase-like lactoylglutathione lyase family enzyme